MKTGEAPTLCTVMVLALFVLVEITLSRTAAEAARSMLSATMSVAGDGGA